jgi:hypothetical protein
MMKLLNLLLVLLFLSSTFAAQRHVPVLKRTTCGSCLRRIPRKQLSPQPAEFFVGEARVDVTKDETVVKLAMAQHGSVFIELPANDGPRYIMPGDPEMATVDEKALERNKRAIIVRPGSLFLPPLRNLKTSTPAATVTAQMRSGLVVTFLFYPVEDLAQNVHRCVLHYNRDEVIARRRAAGLPVNLDGTSQGGEMTVQPAAPKSISVEDLPKTAPPLPQPSPVSNWILDERPIPYIPDPVSTATQRALTNALKAPEQFIIWTKPIEDLTLSLKTSPATATNTAIVVLAVRNKSSSPRKLAPNSPELLNELIDRNDKPIDIRSIKTLHIETSDTSGVIEPNKTIYFAIAYHAPTLNSNQRIRIQVSHTNAVDVPASIVIAKGQTGVTK